MTRRLVFSGERLWVRRAGDRATAVLEAPPPGADLTREPLAAADGSPLEVVDAPDDAPPVGVEVVGLRVLFDLATPEEYALAARAYELLHWRRTHRFCGHCGRPLARHATERAMSCNTCHDLVYPRTNPVVIVRVTRGREILLARRAQGATNFFSVLAGFVEAGETLEEAAVREIREEVGIEVRDLRYFASQPWPYPNNLMIAFTAEHAAGDIRADQTEIAEAHWFTADALPPIPSRISVSRRLIDAWRAH